MAVNELIDQRRKEFFMVDNAIVMEHAAEIGIDALGVYCLLVCCAGSEGSAFPSISFIAAKLGRSYTTVQKALKRLEEHGLILKESKRNSQGMQTSSTYYILPLSVDENGPSVSGTGPLGAGHRHNNTQINNTETTNSSLHSELVGDGQPSLPSLDHKPEKQEKKYNPVADLVKRREAALEAGRDPSPFLDVDRSIFGKAYKGYIKDGESPEVLSWAMDYMVAKACGEINGYKGWVKLHTARDAVKEGWRPGQVEYYNGPMGRRCID